MNNATINGIMSRQCSRGLIYGGGDVTAIARVRSRASFAELLHDRDRSLRLAMHHSCTYMRTLYALFFFSIKQARTIFITPVDKKVGGGAWVVEKRRQGGKSAPTSRRTRSRTMHRRALKVYGARAVIIRLRAETNNLMSDRVLSFIISYVDYLWAGDLYIYSSVDPPAARTYEQRTNNDGARVKYLPVANLQSGRVNNKELGRILFIARSVLSSILAVFL